MTTAWKFLCVCHPYNPHQPLDLHFLCDLASSVLNDMHKLPIYKMWTLKPVMHHQQTLISLISSCLLYFLVLCLFPSAAYQIPFATCKNPKQGRISVGACPFWDTVLSQRDDSVEVDLLSVGLIPNL